MKPMSIIVIISLLTWLGTSCDCPMNRIQGQGEPMIKYYNPGSFETIVSDHIIDVEYACSDTFAVKLEAQPNLIEFIEIYVNQERLHIDVKEGINLHPTSRLKVYIDMPDIRSLQINGTGSIINTHPFDSIDKLDIMIKGTGNATCQWLTAENLTLSINGTGDISTRGNTSHLFAEIDGTGDITYSGSSEEAIVNSDGTGNCFFYGNSVYLKLLLNGTGDFYGRDFSTRNADVYVDGPGDAEVFATESLTATIKGSGNVFCYGNPQWEVENDGCGDFILQSSGREVR
ncbi:MAG: head GIN domain-containing protein [Bacteroidales bacterium]